MRKPVSVTLQHENLLWLRGQAAARGKRSMSEVLDALVTKARTEGKGAITSVAGTIDLPHDDELEWADAYVRSLFEASVQRPPLVREGPPAKRGRRA
jgi:hypothetical protein